MANDRRSFLRGLASLPLIGGSVAILGRPSAAAVPGSDDLMTRYVAFLAAEHREALVSLFEMRGHDFCIRHPPIYWVPDAHQDAANIARASDPSTRAAVILSAAGVPLSKEVTHA